MGRTKLGCDTFWNKKRIEHGIQSGELSELLKCNPKTVSAYFTGQAMPKGDKLATLCDFFGVDIEEGRLEFEKAYQEYWSNHTRTYQKKTNNNETAVTKPSMHTEPIGDDANAILSLLYNVLSFEEFDKIYTEINNNINDDSILKSLYNVIDYDLYSKIYAILHK